MTKVTIQRTFDPSKIYGTDAGKQVKEFVDAQLSVNELVLRILLNGISFEDNVNCLVKDLDLQHNVPQTVGITKPVSMILCGRVFNREARLTEPIHWYYDDQNQLTVLAQFFGSPAVAIKVRTVVLFS